MTMTNNGRLSGGYYPGHVMNAGESEGSGSSGRVDMEITASEDSSIPSRKCISLNSNKHDIFSVPTQVLPLSGISRPQRKDLVHRLRAELGLIQNLQKKVEFQRKKSGTLSTSSDIYGHNKIQNENHTENFSRSSMPGKILNQQGHNARGWNRGTTGRFETLSQAPMIPSSTCLILMRQCDALLKRLMSHQYGWVFNSPVDVVKLNLPDYFTIIKHPMDLGTVKNKLASGIYITPLEFLDDVRLTFSNAMTYNPRGNDVHFMADTMSKFFEVRWKSIQKKIPVSEPLVVPENAGPPEVIETAKQMPPAKKRKMIPLQRPVIPEPIVERIMTDVEKQDLSRDLESMLADMPIHIINFLKDHSSNGKETVEDEIEIDIDEFNDDTLFALRKLLDDHMQEEQKNHAKAEPCEMELLNESGLSNSSMQPCKGNDPVDEDVDIGGNEPPVSSYSPVEIEKDSDSSSDSDDGGDKTSIPVNVTEVYEVLESTEAHTHQEITLSVGAQIERKQATSGLDQVEAQFQQTPNAMESDYCQDGDSAPTERQVSPEKLYRAAILKNRFADTILKAREKTLKQGVKVDPEKLRREKEELELQQRKEKARLQADAKAAEDARKRVVAEAAAEAKRKRELERQAARQALLQMEKTVEINENSRFLEDLEMLRAAPVDPIPIHIDETSPEDSQDGLGGFKFGSSNPLEQLGLYMRVEEEEEEGAPSIRNPLEQFGLFMRRDDECEPPSIPNPLESLGLFVKNDEDEEEGELLSVPNPMEKLGLFMRKEDEEEDGELPETYSSNPVEQNGEEGQLPSVLNPLEQNGLYMKKVDEEFQGEVDNASNPVEQFGLYMKNDDEEEEEGELPDVSNMLEQDNLYVKKNNDDEQDNNLYVKKNDDKEGQLQNVLNPMEHDGLDIKMADGNVECELPTVSNSLEQDKFYVKKNDDEENQLQSVLNPMEHDGLDMKMVVEDVECELPTVSNSLEQGKIYVKKNDDEQGQLQNVLNLMEHDGFDMKMVDENVECELPTVSNSLEQDSFYVKKNDGEESRLQNVLNPMGHDGLDMKMVDENVECELPTVSNSLGQDNLYVKKNDDEKGRLQNVLNLIGADGLTMKIIDEDVECELPTVSNSLEQDSFYVKKKDDEEGQLQNVLNPTEADGLEMKMTDEDGECELSTVSMNDGEENGLSMLRVDELPSFSNPLEQDGKCELSTVSMNDEEENGLSMKRVDALPSVSNPLEQDNLYLKKNDEEEIGFSMKRVHEEVERELPSVSNHLVQDGSSVERNDDAEGEPSIVPNLSDQLGLSMEKVDEDGLSLERNDDAEGEPSIVPDLSDQLGLSMEKVDEEEQLHEPTSVPEPSDLVGLSVQKDDKEKETCEQSSEPKLTNCVDEIYMDFGHDLTNEPTSARKPSDLIGLSVQKDDQEKEACEQTSLSNLTNGVDEIYMDSGHELNNGEK